MTEIKHDHCCDKDSEKEQTILLHELSQSETSTFLVSGMDCADEIEAIKKALSSPRIGKISANLMSSQVVVEHDPSLTKNEIEFLINSAGVKVKKSHELASFLVDNKSRVFLVGLSGFFLLWGLIIQWFFPIHEKLLLFIFSIATLAGGTLVFPKALRALKQKYLDMNVLMTFAVLGAFAIKEYSEGSVVVFLFSLAEMLEAFSVARARKAIREVLSITPQVAMLEIGQETKVVFVEEIQIGQSIVVLAGDRIPLDGIVLQGNSSVNQAPLTGESQPVGKQEGDVVLAGTINESGTLKIKVTHRFKDSKISNVIRLIEEAQSKKAPAQLFVDQFSKIYTPVVTVVAILVAIIPPFLFDGDASLWFYRSLVFLVIACPCALVIATPVSIVSSLTALAKIGVLVKGGVFLESLGKLRSLAVDKTGTITEGSPKVVSFKNFNQESEQQILEIAYSLEKESTHPLAKAVIKYCEEKNISVSKVLDFKVLQGKGVQGRINNHSYFAGNHKLAHELGVCTPEIEAYLSQLEAQAYSVLIVGHQPHEGCSGEVIAILGLADEPRAHIKTSIQWLHDVGIREITILSGDNQRTVDAIAKRVGIDKALGDLLPEDKVKELQKLLERHQFVGMIGDGINDAPALAQATIGIAMGAVGTDAAIETADVALMTDDLSRVSQAVDHGRKTLRIIHFNIAFALLTKAIFIVLGIFGYSSLWLAVAADMGATLLVITNSLRLLKIDTTFSSQ
ncbi:MAG: cation-translocating P-type ATPase [Bdellovibrionaceae bacterium]|nr:cation-translocating P-type ATPase [Pseudobdellovibrionaceae bacterium]